MQVQTGEDFFTGDPSYWAGIRHKLLYRVILACGRCALSSYSAMTIATLGERWSTEPTDIEG